ncbi:hypothetical protein Hdeb2414_s0010g00333981 [Helianthus debilis subsp. tardiflorus]
MVETVGWMVMVEMVAVCDGGDGGAAVMVVIRWGGGDGGNRFLGASVVGQLVNRQRMEA